MRPMEARGWRDRIPEQGVVWGRGPARQKVLLDLPNYDRFVNVALQHPESLVRCGFVWS